MLKPKLPLQAFSAAIAQSVSKANEMLQLNHKVALQRYRGDQFGTVMPPPPPLMIQNVRVKFKGNVSKHDPDGELFIDLSRPDGNFGAEMEFAPFSDDMLKAAKHDGGRNIPFAAKTAAKPVPPPLQPSPQLHSESVSPVPNMYHPTPEPHALDLKPANAENSYDLSDTPRNYGSDL